MAGSPVPIMPHVTRYPTACPNCGGEISVYLFTRAVDWANTPRGLELVINTHHHLGPHACYPSKSTKDIVTDALDTIADAAQQLLELGTGWKTVDAQHTYDLIRSVYAEMYKEGVTVPMPLVTTTSVLALHVESMLTGDADGRTAEQMWNDLQEACAEFVGAVNHWKVAHMTAEQLEAFAQSDMAAEQLRKFRGAST